MAAAASPSGSPLATVGPDLYRANSFRVTGLPVTATNEEIRRQQQRLQIMKRFKSSAVTTGGVLPLPEPPSEEAIQDAIERLRDPVSRLVDELFWFWPMPDGEPDPGMAALSGDDSGAAAEIWKHERFDSSPRNMIARHNAAVLAHVRALDSPVRDAQTWNSALMEWSVVCDDTTFWDLVTQRAAELDDVRANAATVRQVRAALPEAVLSVNATLAVRAAREGIEEDLVFHRALVDTFQAVLAGNGTLHVGTASRLIRRELEPDLARIRSLGADVLASTDAAPATGADAARRYLDQAAPVAAMVGQLLDPDDPVRRGACDDVAITAMHCAVLYADETGDIRSGYALLERALPFAATKPVLADVRQNMDIARDLINGDRYQPTSPPKAAAPSFSEDDSATLLDEILREAGAIPQPSWDEPGPPAYTVSTSPGAETLGSAAICWFDKVNPAARAWSVPLDMTKQTTDQWGYPIVARETVLVPRCVACAIRHRRRHQLNKAKVWPVSLCWVGLNAVPFLIGIPWLIALTLIVSLIGVWQAKTMVTLRGIPLKQWKAIGHYPRIRRMIAMEGWRPEIGRTKR